MVKLLLIEDDLEMQGLIKVYLEQAKFEVVTTHSPTQALEILKDQKIALI